jgi:phospholipid/cholesterol/gamma-HCH transport system permease protein
MSRELARQCTRVGAAALPVVAIGGALGGAALASLASDAAEVLAWLARHAPGSVAPSAALLLVAAPVGARMAGDVSALRDGGQLAWLRAAGRSAFRDVVGPRLAAALLVLPIAALVADAALLGAASLVATHRGVAVAGFAALAPGAVAAGALGAGVAGAVIAAVACAAGLVTRAAPASASGPVARAAARGAAGASLAAAAIGLGWLAGAR